MDYAQIGLHRPRTPDNEPLRTRFRKKNGTIKEKTAVWIVCVTAMALFGYDQAVIGGVIVGDQFIKQFADPSPGVLGFTVAIYDIGCFIGCILCVWVGELLGRRRTIILGVSIMALGATLQTFSTNITEMSIGRLIAGVGNGFNTATAPVYHSEVSEAHDRGKNVVMEMFINVCGFVISNWTTLLFSPLRNNLQWRIPLGGQLIFAGVIAAALPFAPESPRWLMMHGHRDAGIVVISQLDNMPLASERVQKEASKIQESIDIELRNKVDLLSIIRGKDEASILWRAFLGIALQAMQQLSGINVCAYYFPVVLQKSVGLSENWARIVAAFNSISFCLANLVPFFLIERAGRRKLLIVLAITNSLCFLAAFIFLSRIEADPSFAHLGGILATMAFVLFFISFGSGWCEINSIGMRTKGAALASASDWLFNYFIVQLAPLGIHHLKSKFYLIFFVFNLIFAPIETAGKSLEDIDEMFRGEKHYLVIGKRSSLMQHKRIREEEEIALINEGLDLPELDDDMHSLGSDIGSVDEGDLSTPTLHEVK